MALTFALNSTQIAQSGNNVPPLFQKKLKFFLFFFKSNDLKTMHINTWFSNKFQQFMKGQDKIVIDTETEAEQTHSASTSLLGYYNPHN